MLTYHFQIGLSREKELEYVKLLNKNGFGVPLIASFKNGIVSKLVAGKPLDDENVIDKMADKGFARFTNVIIIDLLHVSLFITKDEFLLSDESSFSLFLDTVELNTGIFTNRLDKF